MFLRYILLTAVFAFGLLLGMDVWAVTSAHPLGLMDPVGKVAEEVVEIYNFIFWTCLIIFLIVQGIILYCVWKFRRSVNKKAATFTHNNTLEFFWTLIPAVICIVIAWQSYKAMHFIRTMPEEGLDVEVIAYQFGWDFDYPALNVTAPEPEAPHAQLSSAGETRFVKELVVPVNTNVRLHITSKDVIHAFYVPKLGVKIDAFPGRINYQWFNATQEGEFIGQCAELCGSAHGEMFFVVKAVSEAEFQRWRLAQG